jgi:septin family protein
MTYLVVFDCLVMDEPYIKYIKADSLSECEREAYKISCGSGLSQGNYTIYREVTPEEYEAEEDFNYEEDC